MPLPDFSGWQNPAAFGSKPTAPTPVSTAGVNTGQAISNQSAVYNQLPGYAASIGNIGANIQSETAGEVPEDVRRQLEQEAAERGIATGSPGSDNANASLLDQFGLTSLQLTNMGQGNLQDILPTLPGAGIAANPGFYTTPQQQYEAGLQNSIFQSAPDPAAAAKAGVNAVAGGFAAGRGSGGVSLPGFNSTAGNDWWNQPAAGGTAGGGSTNPGGGGSYIGGVYYGPGQAPGNGDLIGNILQSYAPTVYGGNDPTDKIMGQDIDNSQPAQLALGGFDSSGGGTPLTAGNYPGGQ